MTRAYATPAASVHWYCKDAVAPQRKIGHVNIVGPTRSEARRRLEAVAPGASAALGGADGASAEVAIIMGSDSDLPTMALAAQARTHPRPHACAPCMPAHAPAPPHLRHALLLRCAQRQPCGHGTLMHMAAACMQVLKDFDVPCEVSVVSAHRTPERMFEFARTAHERGIKVRSAEPHA
jgi:phosphoribosylaminoimidazole carboxylase